MGVKVVTVMRWYVQDEVNQDYSEQNEVDGMKKGADSTGKLMHMWKSTTGKRVGLTIGRLWVRGLLK